MSGIFCAQIERRNYTEDENELKQFTIRLPIKSIEKYDRLAKISGCSTAEVIRRTVNDNLNKYLDNVQYVDRDQGEAIKKQLENLFTEISSMRMELHRIGVNYNQEVRLKNLQKQFAERKIDMLELMNMRQSIVDECKDFSPEAINKIIEKFDAIIEEFVNVMAYTRISHTRNGRAAIQYARGNGQGHNGHAKRNLLIGGVGMLPDDVVSFEAQMAEDWARASGKNKNQIRRIVVSYSEKELDPQDEDSAYLALGMAQEFVEEAYPNRKSCIFVQNDGVGGKLHAHILVSNVDSIEHKGCTDEQTKFEYVKQNFNRVAGRHITLDKGKKAKEKFSQNERRLQEENEEAADNGGAAVYIWKDDLRERIRIAMEAANSEDDFLEALEDEGVAGRYGNSKMYGAYISYELLDVPDHMANGGRKCKARSYNLGDAYGVEALREKLREKANELLQTAEQQDDATERGDLFGASQSELNTAAVLAPVNRTPEMTYSPVKKSKDIQAVRDTINALISGPRQTIRAETPIPAQPISMATAPLTAAVGTDSTPEQKQPIQSATAPQEYDGARIRLQNKLREEAEEARKQKENQYDDMDWSPRR